MKTNIKALELIEKGLSSKTVSKLSESQIDILHSKLINEQSGTGTTMVPRTDAAKIQDLKNKKQTFQVYEKEIDEEEEVTVDPNKDTETQDPHQVGPSSDDGFGNETDDGMGMFEEDYKDGPNPWAICHAQVGPKKTRKFERCVMSVKKQLKEGKNPVSLFLENQISKIVEKHIPPRITKGDLIKYITEASPAPAPTTKPAPTKPGVKPGTRPRPSHPGKNPNPGENPSPKAKKVSPEDAKEKIIDTIMNLLQK
jgi:hypothetical protein